MHNTTNSQTALHTCIHVHNKKVKAYQACKMTQHMLPKKKKLFNGLLRNWHSALIKIKILLSSQFNEIELCHSFVELYNDAVLRDILRVPDFVQVGVFRMSLTLLYILQTCISDFQNWKRSIEHCIDAHLGTKHTIHPSLCTRQEQVAAFWVNECLFFGNTQGCVIHSAYLRLPWFHSQC